MIRCFCCGKVIETETADDPMTIGTAYGGLWFRSGGNYGSTIFDPMFFIPGRSEEWLQIVICDICVKTHAKRVTRIHNIKRKTTAESGEFTP